MCCGAGTVSAQAAGLGKGAAGAPRVAQQVAIHAFDLSAHTKIPIDTVIIDIVAAHLCNVSHPDAFAARLRRALARSATVPYAAFRQDFVRMRVRVSYRDSTQDDVFLDKGGKYALFHQHVYRLRDTPRLDRLLRQALPNTADGVMDPELKRDYRKEDFSPMEKRLLKRSFN